MRNKVFSMILGALACLILTFPVAAQGSRGGFEGFFSGLYEAIAAWFEVDDVAEVELVFPGDTSNVTPVVIPGGHSDSGGSSLPPVAEAGPTTMPGG